MSAKVPRRVLARTVAERLLAEPLRRSYWVKALVAFLVDANMTDQAELVANDIAHEVFAQSGELLVNVISARSLNDTIQQELQTVLCAQTGAHKVVFTQHIDASLIGGLIAHTPDQQLDTSIRSQLQQLATIK